MPGGGKAGVRRRLPAFALGRADCYAAAGGVAEWFKAAVLKTAGWLRQPVGSNPTPSAQPPRNRGRARRPISHAAEWLRSLNFVHRTSA